MDGALDNCGVMGKRDSPSHREGVAGVSRVMDLQTEAFRSDRPVVALLKATCFRTTLSVVDSTRFGERNGVGDSLGEAC